MKQVLEEIALKKIAAGNWSACRYIVDKYKDYAYNIAFNICKNAEDAEEAAQDAFMKAFKNLDRFNFNSKFSTWLYRIVVNTAIDATRRQRYFTVPVEGMDGEEKDISEGINEAYHRVEAREREEIVGKAVRKLNDEEILLVNLYYHYDHTTQEIAFITKLSIENVKVKLHRIRKKLLGHLSAILKNELNDLL